VDAVAEGQVTGVGPGDVEGFRVGVPGRVPVGCGQRDDHLGEGGDDGLAEGDVLGGVPERGVRDRCVPAQDFLDRVRYLSRVGDERVALFRVQQQGDRAVADQAGRRVVPGDHQLEDRGEHLLLGQRAALISRADQIGDQILARGRTLAREEIGQVLHDVRRSRHGLGRRLGR